MQANSEDNVSVITAAAKRLVKLIRSAKQTSQGDSRQSKAWTYWDDDTPEVGFAATWIGNQMGRARLYAGIRSPDGSVEALPDDHPASELVSSIAGGPTGQAAMLTEFGPHLVVPGEGWIIIEFAPTEEWHIVSTDEIARKSDGLTVQINDRELIVPAFDPDTEPNENDTTPLAIRVWNPHPRKHNLADSPIMRSFALLDELRLLNAAVAAIAKSRLTGRGIVFVPQGTQFPGGEDDDFLQTLAEVAGTAYRQPDSAAATVPIILEVPPETVAAIQHMTFESDFDTLAVTLREETIRRFATSLDTPAEILLGTASINHWGQWAVEESAIRVAIEPRLGLVCDALTDQWLRPALETLNDPAADAGEAVVWYDASALRVRTNRGQTAIEMFGLGEISGEALRRETNFDDGDKPSPEDEERQLLIRVVSSAPSLAPLILPLLGVDLPDGAVVAEGEEVVVDPEAPVELPADEEGSPPDDSEIGTETEGLFASCDGLVYRALERAGQRLRSRSPRCDRADLQEIEASAVHTEVQVANDDIDELKLLDSAWTRAGAISARYGVDPDEMIQALDDHVRTLLVTGYEYDENELRLVVEKLSNGPT